MCARRISLMASGLRLSALEWSPEGTPDRTVLLLHGYLDMAWSWRFCVEALHAAHPESRRWRIVALDWRGHGESEWIGPGGYYHFMDYVRDLEQVTYGLVGGDAGWGPLVVVGHSMGAGVASLWAGTRPERLDGLVLVEGIGVPPSSPDDAPERTRRWLSQTAPFDGVRFTRPMADIHEAAKRLCRFDPLLPEARALILAEHATTLMSGSAFEGQGGEEVQLRWRYDPLHRTRSPLPVLPAVADAFARQIEAPALWIGGAESPWSEAAVASRLDNIPGLKRTTLSGAGHMVQHHVPEDLAREIAMFISGLESTAVLG
ncbi:MAG: alpha/beta fold hydrolase [Bradymonadia bacterium]